MKGGFSWQRTEEREFQREPGFDISAAVVSPLLDRAREIQGKLRERTASR
jgi:hypothetical protein